MQAIADLWVWASHVCWGQGITLTGVGAGLVGAYRWLRRRRLDAVKERVIGLIESVQGGSPMHRAEVLAQHVKPRRRKDVKPALRELLDEGRIVYWNGFYFLRGREPRDPY